MQAIMAVLMHAADYDGTPPVGPPTNVQKNYWGTGKIYFTWSLGDNDAEIDYSYDSGSTIEGVLAPKAVSYSTAFTDLTWGDKVFAVRHRDGIYTTAWALDEGGI